MNLHAHRSSRHHNAGPTNDCSCSLGRCWALAYGPMWQCRLSTDCCCCQKLAVRAGPIPATTERSPTAVHECGRVRNPCLLCCSCLRCAPFGLMDCSASTSKCQVPFAGQRSHRPGQLWQQQAAAAASMTPPAETTRVLRPTAGVGLINHSHAGDVARQPTAELVRVKGMLAA